MADKLKRYRAKRDFEATSEPAGDGAPDAEPAARFVVQEHHATRLHWDLRLERDGVAVSWAVPNGIPDDPAEDRKAVHTEDHPLEYLEWEGDIPKGEYGAGKMRIWDRGTYECEKWEARKVIVRFAGERVRGRYALFQTGGDGKDWMIHRMDPPADPAREPMPERLVPMLAKLGKLPTGKGWAFEIKWDGVRAIAYSQPGRLRLESRNLLDVTAQYPEVRHLNRALGSHTAVLDGEIVAFDDEGRPSFERLQGRMHLKGDAAIRRVAAHRPVVYVIFDVLYLDGHSLMGLPYSERRARLEALELEGPGWQTPRHHVGQGDALLAASARQGLEGIVAKRVDSPYEPGRRGGSWVKVKNTRRQELVIGGWLPGEGRRRDRIGALLVGVYDHSRDEPALRFAGKVGTGFDEAELVRLGKLLADRERPSSPFEGRQPERGALFVEPELVAEVEFTEWTSAGMLRHPSYKGLRDDKHPLDVVMEREEEPLAEPAGAGADGPPAAATDPLAALRALVRPGHPLRGGAEATVDGRRVRLTGLDEVLYPKPGVTKAEVLDYYVRVAPVLLPHLEGRAGGAEGLGGLLRAVNGGDVEVHASLARAEDADRPAAVAFDLVPGSPAGILECCRVALRLRGMLERVGLRSWAKTSGANGLHVHVPLNGEDAMFEQTMAFARAVAETVERADPDEVVSRRAKAARKGKVLVDWRPNDPGEATLAPYSLRAGSRPTVSTPVTWDEVERALAEEAPDALTFDPAAVLARIAEHGDVFAPVLSAVQRLPG